VCRNYACRLPAEDADTLIAQLLSAQQVEEIR
jgi:hypothetical protein